MKKHVSLNLPIETEPDEARATQFAIQFAILLS